MKNLRGRDQSGQVIIEYVLLMVIAVTRAVTLTKELVSRNPDSPGVLVSAWQNILGTVGDDLPDKL